MKVIDVGQHVDANDVIDLGAQVFDAQFYQALGRQTMTRQDAAAYLKQCRRCVDPIVLDGGFQSGKRMIQIAAATADIKHGVARLRMRREQAHGLTMSRHFRNLAPAPPCVQLPDLRAALPDVEPLPSVLCDQPFLPMSRKAEAMK